MTTPRLHGPRVGLRPFRADDAAEVQRLAGDPAIAATTATIPHPYSLELAQRWIASLEPGYPQHPRITWAIVRPDDDALLGCISLIGLGVESGELAYWIGTPHWGRGYMQEAARLVLAHAFEVLGLAWVEGFCLAHNPASARVMTGIGMQPLGQRFAREFRGREETLLGFRLDVAHWARLV
ncbi:GNAT family N-acetyltransferase [Pseudomonas sp. USHLN015]|uniref:GNAT family N-acetyltransferase n=1 Tax=Pseudomonas sp. USHLN015 TaxID=3081296 RepID=UPI00301C7E37